MSNSTTSTFCLHRRCATHLEADASCYSVYFSQYQLFCGIINWFCKESKTNQSTIINLTFLIAFFKIIFSKQCDCFLIPSVLVIFPIVSAQNISTLLPVLPVDGFTCISQHSVASFKSRGRQRLSFKI